MAYPVAQAVGMRLVYLGNGDIDVETVVELFFHVAWFEDDADSEQVINLLERDVLGLHLVPDGVDRFHTCQNPVFQPHLVQLGADRSSEVVEYFVAFGGGSIQLFFYFGIFFGVFVFETEVFKLCFDLVQT